MSDSTIGKTELSKTKKGEEIMRVKEKITLKPCPFCGEKLVHDSEYYSGPVWKRLDERYRVECPKCYAQTTEYRTAKEAIDAWNNRPIEDEMAKMLDDCLEELTFCESESAEDLKDRILALNGEEVKS